MWLVLTICLAGTPCAPRHWPEPFQSVLECRAAGLASWRAYGALPSVLCMTRLPAGSKPLAPRGWGTEA
jgi:hypothetical protein